MSNTPRRCTVFSALIILLTLCGCSGESAGYRNSDEPNTLSVVVSFDALYELAAAVGGERVTVSKIIPDGAETHDFEPKAKDLAALSSADIFIINGLGLEPWSEDAVKAAGNSSLIVTDVSEAVTPIELSDDLHDEDSHSHHEGSYDPHIWLSPVTAMDIAKALRNAFSAADPDGTAVYSDNYAALAEELSALINDYADRFSELESKTIVTSHAVFAYLCRDFGLIQNSIEGVFSEGEPSAKELARLVEFCRDNNVTAILAERLSSSQTAETLAAEAGASVLTVYTMESAEDGLSFIQRMSENLAVIYESLK